MQYFVLTPLNHNLAIYAPGSSVELDETTAAHLIEAGVVRDPNAPVEAPKDDLSKRVHDAKNGTDTPAPAVDVETAPVVVDDATPATDNKPSVSEDMKRDELEAIALQEGATQEMIDACGNKASLVSLIEANRAPAPAVDVSAGL